MKYAIVSLFVTVSCLAGQTALASDMKLRGETVCFPAKDVPKLVGKLAEVDAERRKIVDVRLEPRFIIKDEGVWPDRFYLAKDGAFVADLPFSRETGAVPSFLESTAVRPDTDICIDDPTRAERPKDDEGLYFEMGLSPLFKTTPGQHSVAELKQGAKDGKKFYKKMLPGAIAILMPDTDYFAIRMIDRAAMPAVFAKTTHGETALALEAVKDMWIVRLDDIEDVMAETLIIRGGAYDLQPVPAPKILRKFGMGDASHQE